jgi:hypothetical protein
MSWIEDRHENRDCRQNNPGNRAARYRDQRNASKSNANREPESIL